MLHVIGSGKDVGKTRLLQFITSEMKKRGYRIGFIKHSPLKHELDTPGTDTHRLQQAGVNPAVFFTPFGISVVIKDEDVTEYEKLISGIFSSCDLLLIESHRSATAPKIVVADSLKDMCDVQNIVAVVSTKISSSEYPVFLPNDERIIPFIIERMGLAE
jgi:molybdopterin-guanine dinucleotide biosynthesis protein MobB